MKLFITYLKGQYKWILIFTLCFGLLLASFLLYHLPLLAVVYPSILCLVLIAVFLVTDFFHVRNVHKCLSEMTAMTASLITSLPRAESIEAADYQDIIRSLQEEVMEWNTSATLRDQEMTEYYTVWVHQIKTPISAMRLMLENEDTEFSRKLMLDLLRIEQYVEMVLAFLRLDAPTSDYVFENYCLDSIVSRSVAKFATEFIERKLRLEYEPLNLSLITDEKWFAFVIEQILSNALKYTKEGSIKIYAADTVTLCIEDTGIGIAPEDLPRIFDKGYTGYNGRLDTRASGIGLYLCRRICNNLGIQIAVQSQLDRGSLVTLRWKRQKKL